VTGEVRHDADGREFQRELDGSRAVLQYELSGGVMSILHTRVPDAIGGRGIAAELTGAALRHARAAGWKVRPLCSYAAAYLRKHVEYEDLLAQ